MACGDEELEVLLYVYIEKALVLASELICPQFKAALKRHFLEKYPRSGRHDEAGDDEENDGVGVERTVGVGALVGRRGKKRGK